MVVYKLKSLRRYDPDQVLRVEALGLLSPEHGLPVQLLK